MRVERMVDCTYQHIIRPYCFEKDPEVAHNEALDLFRKIGRLPSPYRKLVSKMFITDDERLQVRMWGVNFPKETGLAAGYCKDGDPNVIKGLSCIDPGFIVVGSVSENEIKGNERPRLFRLPEHEVVINRMGLNNPGADVVVNNLKQLEVPGKRSIPVGVSVVGLIDGDGKLGDPIRVLDKVYRWADFLEINVSCPNHGDLRGQYERGFDKFSDRVAEWRDQLNGDCPPIVYKLSPDHSENVLMRMAAKIIKNQFDGVVASNTSERRDMFPGNTKFADERGGLSGPPLREISLRVVSRISDKFPALPLIGVGGISNHEHVEQYKSAGAKLFQVYTGLIFMGPGVFRKMHRGMLANTY